MYGGAKVPSRHGMWGPCAALGWLFMDHDFGAGWSNRGAVKIKRPVELGVSGQLWVEVGGAEKVEGKQRLGEDGVPERQVEAGVGTAERGDEVVLEGTDGALCGVAAMDMRGTELEFDVLGI